MPEMQDEGMSKIELFWINFESWIWGFPLDQLQVSGTWLWRRLHPLAFSWKVEAIETLETLTMAITL